MNKQEIMALVDKYAHHCAFMADKAASASRAAIEAALPDVPTVPDERMRVANRLMALAAIMDDCGRLISTTGDAQRVMRNASSMLSAAPEPAQAEQPRNEPVQQEPVLFVSPEQLNGFKDPEEGDLVDASTKPFGRYIPARKTPAGKFTQPLYTSPQAQPMSDEQIKELEEMNAQLREQNNMVSQACADLERQLEQARSVVNSASALVEAKGLNLHASMVAFTNLEAAIKESK